MQLRTAVSGMGRIGWMFHAPHVVEHPGFTLVGVCDPMQERCKESEDFFHVPAYTAYSEMLRVQKPDLVIIASPSMVHAEQAIVAMEQGVDVFLDKPMAISYDEVTRIVQTQRRTGRKLMMYQPMRVTDETAQLKQILDSGIIGEVHLIKLTVGAFVFRNDWQAFTKYGGGALNNVCSHYIDLLIYLTGAMMQTPRCFCKTILSLGDAEDFVKILMEATNHITVDLEVNMAAAIAMPKWHVYGDKGAATLVDDDPAHAYFHVRYYDPKTMPFIETNDTLAAKDRLYIHNGPTEWNTVDYPVNAEKDKNYFDYSR